MRVRGHGGRSWGTEQNLAPARNRTQRCFASQATSSITLRETILRTVMRFYCRRGRMTGYSLSGGALIVIIVLKCLGLIVIAPFWLPWQIARLPRGCRLAR